MYTAVRFTHPNPILTYDSGLLDWHNTRVRYARTGLRLYNIVMVRESSAILPARNGAASSKEKSA